MTLRERAFYSALVGAGVGLLVWIAGAATGLVDDARVVSHLAGRGHFPFWPVMGLSVLICALLGTALAVFEFRGTSRSWAALCLGLALGAAGGVAGALVQALLYVILPKAHGPITLEEFLVAVFSSAFAWAVATAPVGAVSGVARRAAPLTRQGVFGAMAGGLIGGGLLRIAGEAFAGDPETVSLTQAAAIVILAALTAYLASLLPDLMKTAWVSVQIGAGRPGEYLVARPVTSIGSGGDCDIVIASDTRVAPVHAVIEAIPDTNRHRLRHAARNVPSAPDRFPPTRLNGEALTSEKWLIDGDMIVIAGARIVFHERGTLEEAALRRNAQSMNENEPFGEARVYGLSIGPAPLERPQPTAAPERPQAAPRSVPVSQEIPAHPSKTRRRSRDPEPMPARPALPGTGTIGTRLVCIAGPYRGQAFPVTSGQTTIGRDMEHSIPLPADMSVSRLHARIVYENGRHSLGDAGSSHGTELNGEIITEPRVLRTGDVIGLGETMLRYE
jgi:pSer/pThr/pTyr-binding forkhead associated (FHA) protein